MSRYLVVSLFVIMILGIYSIQDSTAGSECPENQQEHICGTLCEPTCSNPQPNRKFCPRIVCTRATSGCRCVKDTVRDTNSTQCVPLDQCS